VLARKLAGEAFSGLELHAELGVPTEAERPKAERQGQIAVIPIVGAIGYRPQSMGTSALQIGAMVDRAAADPNIAGLLYDVDSPGGEVTGIPETADKIRKVAAVKPSLALANGQMASAAYWLGAAAGQIWTLPSGEGAGSIGAWTAHEDWTKALEQDGIKINEFSAGKYKTEFAPWKALTPEAAAFLQERTDEVYGWFVKSVALDRKTTPAAVRGGYGQGRVLGGKEAVEAGLVDKVGTFEDAVAWLTAKTTPRKRGAKAAQLRNELSLDAARLL
jgi:signal peptide peptidase SppA